MAVQFFNTFSINFIGDGTSSSISIDLADATLAGTLGGSVKMAANNIPTALTNPSMGGQGTNAFGFVLNASISGTVVTFTGSNPNAPFVFQSGSVYGISGTLTFNSPLV